MMNIRVPPRATGRMVVTTNRPKWGFFGYRRCMADASAKATVPPPNVEVHASWETRGFWEGAGREELVLQRCASCGLVQHRPRGVCAHCLESESLEHFAASGRGTVYSYTVTEQNQAKGFAEACPYVMAYVTLEEGPRLLTVITDCDPDSVDIGMPVVADFVYQERDDAERFAIPVFRPSNA